MFCLLWWYCQVKERPSALPRSALHKPFLLPQIYRLHKEGNIMTSKQIVADLRPISQEKDPQRQAALLRQWLELRGPQVIVELESQLDHVGLTLGIPT